LQFLKVKALNLGVSFARSQEEKTRQKEDEEGI
jgi:hypothetical protein